MRKIPVTIGFGNLAGDSFGALLDEDAAVLAPLFERAEVAPPERVPNTPIVFLYSKFNKEGALETAPHAGVRQVVEATKAAILVLASPTPEDRLQKVMQFPGSAKANLVFTLDRKGAAFSGFFHKLFGRMRDGESMLQAWVGIAPQGPGGHEDNPETVLLPEAGALAFPK